LTTPVWRNYEERETTRKKKQELGCISAEKKNHAVEKIGGRRRKGVALAGVLGVGGGGRGVGGCKTLKEINV